ncbi:DNA-processing protein DprA [Rhabdothermincola salaria]|uniref:DNA-processing protein DprA n=1 Tax=Rhabdothermincola salaria TaxID=2903142 RepID=UPI001E4EC263|nr:DNA-processing protein DprA [Rhabdothermincola salaria]
MARRPETRYVVALAALPSIGPGRLRRLLDRYGPEGAWTAVRSGRVDPSLVVQPGRHERAEVIERWARRAGQLDPDALWDAHRRAAVGVVTCDSPAFPAVLATDDDPPVVLFWRGDLDHLAGMRAAVVGTRDATRYGLDVAHALGRELAEAGVAVVSGLALGIDGAAHAGVLAIEGAPPIGVVGSGLDRVYPRAHGGLWRAVGERGLLLSEYPLGAPSAAWQFPARNRLIAALADVVVVVESHATGGAMGTAVEAGRRGRTVLAVPGPVTAPSSAGTNQLLFDGCGPARQAADVLLALGVEGVRHRPAAERRTAPTGDAERVLAALPWQPVAVEQLVLATGLALGAVVVAVEQLEDGGWVTTSAGWVERLGRDPGGADRDRRTGRVGRTT